ADGGSPVVTAPAGAGQRDGRPPDPGPGPRPLAHPGKGGRAGRAVQPGEQNGRGEEEKTTLRLGHHDHDGQRRRRAAASRRRAGGCRETPRAKAAELRQIVATRKQQLAQRVAKADANGDTRTAVAKWIMPPKLREISGLVLTSRGTVLAHDDNAGRVYEIDPKS